MSYFHGRSTTTFAFFMFAIGLVLGNIVILSIALVQVIFLIISLSIPQPKKISFKRERVETQASIGHIIERNISIYAEKGIGLIIVNDVIPEEFDLIEGSNYKAFLKLLRPLEAKMEYKITCTKRGEYPLLSPLYESRHLLNVRVADKGGGEKEGTFVVRPRPINIRRILSLKTLSTIPLPLGSIAKGGLPTTDFRELREYSYGDPYNFINWKATARLGSRGTTSSPYVNVFEKEGRKVVWLILDVSPSMSLGTSVRSALDYAVEAADALSRFYLERGCSVGLYVCTEDGVIIPPDTGRRQYMIILRELIRAQTGYGSQPITTAIERCGAYSAGANPLFIILTSITKASAPSIVQGIREARKYSKSLRVGHHAIIVDVNPYSLISSDPEGRLASKMLRILTAQEALAIRRLGAMLVRWDPMERSFSELMLKGLRVLK